MEDYQVTQLSNGLRLAYKYHPSKISHCGFIIDAGSRNETSDNAGIAHFLEHMLFKGTEKKKTLQILNRLEGVGGEMNAYTAKEKTCIYASFSDEYFARALELLTDITFFSIFPEKEIMKEKKVIHEEIDMYDDNPEEFVIDKIQELIYPNHPLGWNILGTHESLDKLNKTDLLNFTETYYCTENIVFSYNGSIPQHKVLKALERYSADIKPGSQKIKAQAAPNYKKIDTVIEKDVNQVYAVLAAPGFSLRDENLPGVVFLTNVLGGPSMNSILNLSVREKFGFVYQIDSAYSGYKDSGWFNIYLGTAPKSLNKSIKIIEKELFKLCNEGIKDNLLARYKKQFKGQVLLSEENRVSLMLGLGKEILDKGKMDSVMEVFQKIDKITNNQIIEISRELFHPARLSKLILGPVNE